MVHMASHNILLEYIMGGAVVACSYTSYFATLCNQASWTSSPPCTLVQTQPFSPLYSYSFTSPIFINQNKPSTQPFFVLFLKMPSSNFGESRRATQTSNAHLPSPRKKTNQNRKPLPRPPCLSVTFVALSNIVPSSRPPPLHPTSHVSQCTFSTSSDEVIITNGGATILSKMQVIQPPATVLVMFSKSHSLIDSTANDDLHCHCLQPRLHNQTTVTYKGNQNITTVNSPSSTVEIASPIRLLSHTIAPTRVPMLQHSLPMTSSTLSSLAILVAPPCPLTSYPNPNLCKLPKERYDMLGFG